MVEQASKVAATSVCPQEKFQLRPDSPGGSPRSVRGSEPASLQISASARFGLREISHVSFRAECLFPVALWLSGFIGLRSQMIWGVCLPGAGPLGRGAQCGAWTSDSLGRTATVLTILPFVGHLFRAVGLDYTVSPPLLSMSLWFLPYIFSCGESFCYSSDHFQR